MSTSIQRNHPFSLGSRYMISLAVVLAASLGAASIIPPQQRSYTLTARECKDEGNCPPGTFWSLVEGTVGGIATCCPQGYKAECSLDDEIPILTTFFCCLQSTNDVPCPASARTLPSTPETCSCGSRLVSSQCMGGNLPQPNAATVYHGLSALWILLGSLLFANLV